MLHHHRTALVFCLHMIRCYKPLVLLAGSLILVSCSVAYDDVADQQIAALTKEIDQQMQAWATQAADGTPVVYKADDFTKIKGDLMALSTRLAASPDITTQDMASRVMGIYTQYEEFRLELKKLSPERSSQFFIAEEKLLDPQLAGLNAYETALKSGAGTGAATKNASSSSGK